MRKLLLRLVNRVGQRGILLLVFATTSLVYGIGLAIGYHPTFDHALDLDVKWYSLAFGVEAIAMFLGAWFRWGRGPYSIGVTVNTFWLFLLLAFWSAHRGYAWVAIMPWCAIAVTQIIAAVWPEPVSEVRPLSPYDLDHTDPAMRAIDYTTPVLKKAVNDARPRKR